MNFNFGSILDISICTNSYNKKKTKQKMMEQVQEKKNNKMFRIK